MRRSCCNMNKILSIVFCVVLLSCSDKDKNVVRSYWDNGNLKSELRYKDGMLHGDCSWYFSNGKPDMKAYYNANVMEGEVLRWYENGNLQSRYFIKNDQYDSIFELYNVFGTLVKLEYYKEGGKKEGSGNKGLFQGCG